MGFANALHRTPPSLRQSTLSEVLPAGMWTKVSSILLFALGVLLSMHVEGYRWHEPCKIQRCSSARKLPRFRERSPLKLTDNNRGEIKNEQLETGATLRSKSGQLKRSDNRDFLPFVVVEDSIKAELGTFLLEPSTSCGDFLDLGFRGIFKVNRVAFVYKYDGGQFRVFRKRLEVEQTQAPWRMDSYSDNSNRLAPDNGILQ